MPRSRRARRSRLGSGNCYNRRLSMRRVLGPIERLEPRLTLSASSLDGRAYIDVGPSDNVAWDQPRVTVQLLTEDFPDGTEPSQNIIVGPTTFNSWLLDTGANTTLAFETAVVDMTNFDPKYMTDGKFNELGVGGVELFDVSIPYRFDFAGSTSYERNKLLDARIISNSERDISIFGPWGIVGMPAMTERVTTLDFTPWTNVSGFDLFMLTDFANEVPPPAVPRFTIEVDNRVNFSPEGSVVSGPGIPMWADLPFLTGILKDNESRAQGNFLFDTGAQVSILSNKMAFDLGLDSNKDGVLNALDSNFARTETIGGIAGTTDVPVFLIDQVHIPTKQGPDMVWTDMQWVILDIVEGIDGVFGFDNLTSGWIEAFGRDGQSGYILKSHLDFRGWDASGKGEIHLDFNPDFFTLVDPSGPTAIVTESGDSTIVTENSLARDTYQIRLTQKPTADVTVTFVGGNRQVGAVDAANPAHSFVVFTPENWSVPQTVMVQAVNDSVQEGFHFAFLRNVSSSADPKYDGVGMPRLSVGIVDDDYAGMMIIPTDGETRVTEGGEPDYYDVVLMTQPVQDVYIVMQHVANQVKVVADATGAGLLIFNSTNWNVPQRVRVTAIDDNLEEPLLPAYISHVVATGDANYQQAFGLQEKVFVRDNDSLDKIGPRITDVILGSSAWKPSFIDVVDGGGVGAGNGLGISLVGNQQLDNLPWVNLNKIYLKFDEDVSTDFTKANLQLTGVNVADYASRASLAYGVDGVNVATITLADPLSNDILLLGLSDAMRDAVGNALDGEWKDGLSLVSGNGTSGGGFRFRLDALAGDVDNSNAVSLVDVFAALQKEGNLTTTVELSRYDVDGNGAVSLVDVFAILKHEGTLLPDPPANGSSLSPDGGDSDNDQPAGGQGSNGGLTLATWIDGYGGLSQVVAGEVQLSSNLDRINPFLRGAMRRAQQILAQRDALLPNVLHPSPVNHPLGALLPQAQPKPAEALLLSAPAVESLFARAADQWAQSTDQALEQIAMEREMTPLPFSVRRQSGGSAVNSPAPTRRDRVLPRVTRIQEDAVSQQEIGKTRDEMLAVRLPKPLR